MNEDVLSTHSASAKLEGLNPGGSANDRPALPILREAMRTGTIKPWRRI